MPKNKKIVVRPRKQSKLIRLLAEDGKSEKAKEFLLSLEKKKKLRTTNMIEYLAWCDREIACRQDQLAPLASGEMRLCRQGTETTQWFDVTAHELRRLRKEILSLQTTVDAVRKEHGPSQRE